MFAHSTFNAAEGLVSGLSVFVTTTRLNSELTTGSSGCRNQRATILKILYKTAAVISNLLRIVYLCNYTMLISQHKLKQLSFSKTISAIVNILFPLSAVCTVFSSKGALKP